jgi:hypothetical protein
MAPCFPADRGCWRNCGLSPNKRGMRLMPPLNITHHSLIICASRSFSQISNFPSFCLWHFKVSCVFTPFLLLLSSPSGGHQPEFDFHRGHLRSHRLRAYRFICYGAFKTTDAASARTFRDLSQGQWGGSQAGEQQQRERICTKASGGAWAP